MKAIVYTKFGSPDVLQLKEVEKPIPGDHEILIKILAASANAYDWRHVRADPFLIRLMGAGLLKPKHRILGADHIIDYTRVDITRNRLQYDLISDIAACRSISAYKRILSPSGIYVLAGGSMARILQLMLISLTGVKNMGIIVANVNQKDLLVITELIKEGKVKSMIDKRYPLSETAEAMWIS